MQTHDVYMGLAGLTQCRCYSPTVLLIFVQHGVTLSLRERVGQALLSGDAHHLQLFQWCIFVFQEPNLCVVRTHTIAQQANRLQR